MGPRIGIWGTFDLADYGNLLLPRILESELRRRLPLAQVIAYSPLGHDHPLPMDAGRPALPLGPPEPQRKKQLAELLDLVVVLGNVIHARDELYADRYGIPQKNAERLRPSGWFVDGLGPDLERRCPIVWHAVEVPFGFAGLEAERIMSALESKRRVTVRDEISRERLEETGTTQQIDVVPDATILVSRLFDADVLRKRTDYLRVIGSYPTDKPPLVIQGDASLGERAVDIAGALKAAHDAGDAIVLAELSQPTGDAQFADAVAPLLSGVFRLPATASVEDITATIARARAFAGASPQGHSVALALGVPSLPIEASSLDIKNSIDERTQARLQHEADAELDELASIAERSWSDRVAGDERTPAALGRALSHAHERYEALLRAHDVRGERLVTERLKFADIVDRLEQAGGGLSAEAAQRTADLENAVFTAQAAEAEARFALEQLRNQREAGG
jgi:Polysaccharide pyruvyl transferase